MAESPSHNAQCENLLAAMSSAILGSCERNRMKLAAYLLGRHPEWVADALQSSSFVAGRSSIMRDLTTSISGLSRTFYRTFMALVMLIVPTIVPCESGIALCAPPPQVEWVEVNPSAGAASAVDGPLAYQWRGDHWEGSVPVPLATAFGNMECLGIFAMASCMDVKSDSLYARLLCDPQGEWSLHINSIAAMRTSYQLDAPCKKNQRQFAWPATIVNGLGVELEKLSVRASAAGDTSALLPVVLGRTRTPSAVPGSLCLHVRLHSHFESVSAVFIDEANEVIGNFESGRKVLSRIQPLQIPIPEFRGSTLDIRVRGVSGGKDYHSYEHIVCGRRGGHDH